MNCRITLFVLAFLMCRLFAQEDADSEAGSPDAMERSAWLVCAGIPEGMDPTTLLKSGEQSSELILSKRFASAPVRIPSDGILQVVERVKPQLEDDRSGYKVLTQAIVPQKVGKALVILSPVENHPQGWVFDAKVVDLADLKGGGWLFMNASPVKVGVDLGDQNMEIPPGDLKLFHGAVQSQSTKMTIRYLPEEPEKSEWKVLSASTVVIYPTRREICIFTWDKRHQRMDYNGITFTAL